MKKISVLALIGILFGCLSAFAQDTAQIVGSVTDSTGAVIPNAKVTVAEASKGIHRDLVSNAAGQYVAAALPIGTYTVTAEAPGFQKLEQTGITLQTGQYQRVDIVLKVGQVTQEVTVTSNAPVVQTETAAISGVVTGTQVANLNLNGRNFVTLALLVPGAVPAGGLDTSHVGVYGNNNISFNGSRTQYNNWEIDGGNNTDEGSASTFNTYPNLDTIAEFRISTSNYGADMGKHAGATIELSTKSGTSKFHGDAAEYVRRDWMDANDFFLNKGGAGKSPLSQHEYGYVIGGPVYIPGHYNTDKSKTFFFWSQDWRKILNAQTMNVYVPSVRQRAGDFSECDAASPNFNAVIADGCVVPTVNGVKYNDITTAPGITAQGISNARAWLDGMVPLPNAGPIKYVAPTPANTHWRQEQIRVDQNVSDRTQVFVRYTQDAWNTLAVPSLWAWASYDTIKTPFDGPGKSMVLHITHTFSPTMTNEFIASYTTDHIVLGNQVGESSPAGSIDRPASFQLAHFFPGNNASTLLPASGACEGVGSNTCFYEDAANHPWLNSNPIINVKDNVVWSRGAHTLKMGFFYQDYRKNEQFGANVQGSMWFDGPGAGLDTDNSLANMYLGHFNYYNEGTQVVNGIPIGGYPKGHWLNHEFEPYFNDDWRVNNHLTLNMGVRFYWFSRIHDITTPTIDSGFIPSLYDPAKQQQLDASGNLIQDPNLFNYTRFGNGLVQCGSGGIPAGCQKQNTWGNWAPRFGFSWDPFGAGKTVIRGGYGIYYEVGNGNEAQTEGGEGNPPAALSPSASNLDGWTAVQPLFDPNTNSYNAALPPTGYTSIPFSQKWGSQQQFNVNIQHQFQGNNILTVGYVGALGRHLAAARHINYMPIGVSTRNAPALANTTGGYCGATDAVTGNCLNGNVYNSSLGIIDPGDRGTTLCDGSGNCDVQPLMIFNEVNSNFFANFRGYGYGNTQKQNTANSVYHALQVNFRHPFGHGLYFETSYTWSKAMDNATSTYGQNYQVDDSNMNRWWSQGDSNRTHAWVINYVYDLPLFKNSSGFAKAAFGGWKISGITSFYSGLPMDGPGQCGVSGFGSGIGTGMRCNSTGPLKIKKGVASDGTPTWYDPSVLSEPTFAQLAASNQPGMFGYVGRNVLVGPGRNNTDLALIKDFQLPWFAGEHSTIQFRWETFNSFNHTQFNSVQTGCDGSSSTVTQAGVNYKVPAFGRACGGGSTGQVNGVYDPRIMQFGLKFIF